MRNRLPLVLSATALVVAVFGITPLGHATSNIVQTHFAKNANFLRGKAPSVKAKPNTIVQRDGKGDTIVGAARAAGRRGPGRRAAGRGPGAAGACRVRHGDLPGPRRDRTAQTAPRVPPARAGSSTGRRRATVHDFDDGIADGAVTPAIANDDRDRLITCATGGLACRHSGSRLRTGGRHRAVRLPSGSPACHASRCRTSHAGRRALSDRLEPRSHAAGVRSRHGGCSAASTAVAVGSTFTQALTAASFPATLRSRTRRRPVPVDSTLSAKPRADSDR